MIFCSWEQIKSFNHDQEFTWTVFASFATYTSETLQNTDCCQAVTRYDDDTIVSPNF